MPLIGGGNEDISSALHISNPAKSWAVYAVLENETVHYFSFDVREGERIYMGLLKSTDPADEGFLPDLLLIGPGIGILSSSPAQQPEGNISLEGAVLLENSAIPKNIILPESLEDL